MHLIAYFAPFVISGFYFLSCFLFVSEQIRAQKKWYSICEKLTLIGAAIHSMYLLYSLFLIRSGENILSFYHALIFLSLVNIFFYFAIMKKSVVYQYALVFPAFSFFLIYLARFLGPEETMTPASGTHQILIYVSEWIHITGILTGILLFSISFVLSVFFLFREKHMKQKKIDLSEQNIGIEHLIRMIYRSNFLGFIAFNLALLFGIIAARVSAENPNFLLVILRYSIPAITWAFYGTLILNCSRVGLRGRFLARTSIIGFFLSFSSLFLEVFILKFS